MTVSRRRFVKSISSAVFSACLVRPTPAIQAAQKKKIRAIDIHTHLGAFYHGQELTAELLVHFMDQHDIEWACVLPLISPEAAPVAQPVTTAIAAAKEFPDRLISFCAVDPRAVTAPGQRSGHVAGVKGVIDILKRYQDVGCKGLGEHKTGLWFDAPQQRVLYEDFHHSAPEPIVVRDRRVAAEPKDPAVRTPGIARPAGSRAIQDLS